MQLMGIYVVDIQDRILLVWKGRVKTPRKFFLALTLNKFVGISTMDQPGIRVLVNA